MFLVSSVANAQTSEFERGYEAGKQACKTKAVCFCNYSALFYYPAIEVDTRSGYEFIGGPYSSREKCVKFLKTAVECN